MSKRSISESYVTHVQGDRYSYVGSLENSKGWVKVMHECGKFVTLRPMLSPSLIHKGGKPKPIK